MPVARSLPQLRCDARDFSSRWLLDCALPLWWTQGADHEGGGFHEQLGLDGKPVGKPSRLHVQTRQIFVYARAGAMGWDGPLAPSHGARPGVDTRALPQTRRLFCSTLDETDAEIDLYEQAFVLLALAHAFAAQGKPVDSSCGVAVFSTDAQGRVTQGRIRLWAQTERLRTLYAFTAPEHRQPGTQRTGPACW